MFRDIANSVKEQECNVRTNANSTTVVSYTFLRNTRTSE